MQGYANLVERESVLHLISIFVRQTEEELLNLKTATRTFVFAADVVR